MVRNGDSRTPPDDVATVLELIASGAALPRVLTTISQMIEDMSPGAISSIFLLDVDGKRLFCQAAPSLPPEVCKAIDGLSVAPDVGCWGTAAYLRERVVVRDTATDPRFVDYRPVFAANELRSSWSEPVLSSRARLLGTVTTYSRTVGEPSEPQVACVAMAANLVSIVVERSRDQVEARGLNEELEGLRSRIAELTRANDLLRSQIEGRERGGQAPQRDETVKDPPVEASPGGTQAIAGSMQSLLSKREREVLRWLAEGHSSKQIAEELFISVKTVETHRTQIMRRLNIRTIAALTKYAVRTGLTTLDC